MQPQVSIWSMNNSNSSFLTRFTKVYLKPEGPPGDKFARHVLSGNAHPAKIGAPLKSNFTEPNVTPDVMEQLKQTSSTTLHKHLVPIRTCRRPVDNITFLKVHKCASSSLANILVRYGLRKDLNFALPKLDNGHIGWPNSFQPTHVLNIQENQPINILAYHIVYNMENVAKVMPKGTKIVGILREPWTQFKSTMNFFKELRQIKFTTRDTVKEFLDNPQKYEKRLFFGFSGKRLGYKSVTHNFLSSEMGLPESYFGDEGKIREYIHFLDEHVDLVMLREYYSQSVVLMRRLLCWDLSDVITMPINSKRYRLDHQEAALKEKHKKWSTADYILYDYFNTTFHKKVQAEGPGFIYEVKQFDKLNAEVERYCIEQKSFSPMILAPSKWNAAIQITRETCKMLKIIPYYMTGMIKKKMVALRNRRNEMRNEIYQLQPPKVKASNNHPR
jgi:galactosylceramide sulfotransferase/galactose-3-O-sulfotransferase 3